MLFTRCGNPVGLKTSIEKIIQQGSSRAGDGAMISALGLALLHLEFNDFPSPFYFSLTKKANIYAIVQVQKFIQLMRIVKNFHKKRVIFENI